MKFIADLMTGLTSPTAGSIYYKDIDVFQNMARFRQNLGMCPQEDRLFPYLSVMDHLLFFGMVCIFFQMLFIFREFCSKSTRSC